MKIMTIQTANVDYKKHPFPLIALLFVILASVSLPVDPHITLLPCVFKSAFDIPCPGCGMTRAFILLGHFHFQEALAMNINSIFAYIILLAITINEMVHFALGRKINPPLSRREIIMIFVICFFVMMAGWHYNLMNERLI